MKNFFYFILLTSIIFFLSHFQFQTSSAERVNDWNKHLVQSDKYYSEQFQFNDVRIDGMEYRIYFAANNYPGGIAIINKTNDKLMKTKLELEIKQLRNELNKPNK